MSDSGAAVRTVGPVARQPDQAREDADVGTSSDAYASRFVGGVGRWFLETQKRTILELLDPVPAGASVLDVGGGHAQIAPALIEAGYEVTVVASDPVCAARLRPWIAAGSCHFHIGDLRALPYADESFDVVVCLRLLPHSGSWTGLIGELCRVARRSVVLDYPSLRSVNILAGHMFKLKQGIELNTRSFLMFTPQQIHGAFAASGFAVGAEQPQFLLPMALHRLTNQVALSKVAEAPGRLLGLTRWFGSPILARADRR